MLELLTMFWNELFTKPMLELLTMFWNELFTKPITGEKLRQIVNKCPKGSYILLIFISGKDTNFVPCRQMSNLVRWVKKKGCTDTYGGGRSFLLVDPERLDKLSGIPKTLNCPPEELLARIIRVKYSHLAKLPLPHYAYIAPNDYL